MPYKPSDSVAGPTIPLSVPQLCGREWSYVKECLDTGWVSSVGSFVDRFEHMLESYVGTRHAVAAVNGTSAIHVTLLVAGVEPDDEVLVPCLTFIAPANAVRYIGAWPVFIDVEPRYWQMDPQRVADFLAHECHVVGGRLRNRGTGRRIAAILPVHILGHPVDMDPIVQIARRYDLPVIEDATESLGAKYRDRMVGHLGDAACFSFNGNKIITTGGGGMIVTDNDAWARRAKYLTTQAKDDPVEFIHGEVGFNHRLTNIQAAIGCAQMEQLDGFVHTKRRIAGLYAAAFGQVPGISTMAEASWACSTFWLYTILIDPKVYGCGRRELLHALAASGVQARPLWQPLHKSPAHAGAQTYGGHVAEDINARALSLPSSTGLDNTSVTRVTEAVIARSGSDPRITA